MLTLNATRLVFFELLRLDRTFGRTTQSKRSDGKQTEQRKILKEASMLQEIREKEVEGIANVSLPALLSGSRIILVS